MNGGSYNYIYSTLSQECAGHMYDAEMNGLIVDLCKVLHDLEWWQSCDSSEKDYRKAVEKFKKKWFNKGYKEPNESDVTVKLIIEISKEDYEIAKKQVAVGITNPLKICISHGIPLDSNSERAEVQAYFAGEAYGWEQGRKALLDDVKAEFKTSYLADCTSDSELNGTACHFSLNKVLEILDNIGEEDKE